MLRLDVSRHPFQLLDELLEAARPRRRARAGVPIEILGHAHGLRLRALLPGLLLLVLVGRLLGPGGRRNAAGADLLCQHVEWRFHHCADW